MRRPWLARGVIAVATMMLLVPVAAAQRLPPGASQADRHNPFSPRYLDMRPGGYDRRTQPPPSPPVPSPGVPSPGVVVTPWYPWWYGRRYFYDLHVDPWYYRPHYFNGLYGTVPIYVPPGTLFGPEAEARRMAQDFAAEVGVQPIPRFEEPGQWERGQAERRARARRLMNVGDEHFENQRYTDAMRVYRQAARTARDLAEPHVRQGQTLLAMQRYSAASNAFQRGLELDPGWGTSHFRFETLYGPNRLAMQVHGNQLSAAAEENPNDPDILFLMGLWYFFGDQPERAIAHFERAERLGLHQWNLVGLFNDRLRMNEVPPEP